MLTLTIKNALDGMPVGTVVQYLGHVTGGMVKISFNGKESIIHPANTIEL
jgi:hypothetical protein